MKSDDGFRFAKGAGSDDLWFSMDLFGPIGGFWHYLIAALSILCALAASAHAILYKRDSRAALLWVGVIWLVPIVGGILYLGLGINRIRRRAMFLRASISRPPTAEVFLSPATGATSQAALGELGACASLGGLARLVGQTVRRPPHHGNRVEPLRNGDQAFPAMVEAIESARASVSLATYIFDNDEVGQGVAQALARAVQRGVSVRVIVDDTGARYSFPQITHTLKKWHVPVARFLPSLLPWRFMSVNLRNHRKLLVVDGRLGFTGGMNIRQGNVLKESPKHPTQDLHFRIEGPVVADLQKTFADDWFFCAREVLAGERWFPPLSPVGPVLARGITDGPDENFETFRWTVLGAMACANRRVQIVTPYFLPDQSMVSALNLAAMRGVEVDIILPAQSNLPYVQWATMAMLWQVLERGCRVWLTAPPFDHSKLMLVDNCWSLIGSANWDPRSYRLNFEFNVECYDAALAGNLEGIVQQKLAQARPITLREVDARPLPIKLRDGVSRLFTPFL